MTGETLTPADLTVRPGKSLSVIAGPVTITNGKLQAPSINSVMEGPTSRLNLISIASPGQVELDATDLNTPIDVSTFSLFGFISVTQGSDVNVDGDGGGILRVRAKNVICDGSFFTAFVNGDTDGSLIDFELSGDLTLRNGGAIASPASNAGNGADISVQANNLILLDSGFLGTQAFSDGTSGNIDIELEDTLHIEGAATTGLFTINAGPAQSGGNITVVADVISVTGLAEDPSLGQPAILATNIPGVAGVSGEIDLTARVLSLDGSALVSSVTNGNGHGGSIRIKADQVIMTNSDLLGSFISTFSSDANGIPGNVELDARKIIMNGVVGITGVPVVIGLLETSVPSIPVATGNISILSERLEMAHGAAIITSTVGSLDGGQISIVSRHISLNASSILSESQNPDSGSFSTGSGGLVTIETPPNGSLVLADNANISSRTFGRGAAGSISLDVGRLEIDQSNIESSSEGTRTTTFGNAGTVGISTNRNIKIQGNSTITSSSNQTNGGLVDLSADGKFLISDSTISAAAGNGNAGTILISAATSVDLLNGQVSSNAGFNGGNIEFTAPIRVHIKNSTVTASAGANGGRIIIDPQLVLLDNSLIDGRAGGQPVQVTIDPDAVFLNIDSQILTAALSAPPELDLAGGLVNMPALQLKTDVELAPTCEAQFATDESSFNVYSPRSTQPSVRDWVPTADLALPPPDLDATRPEPSPAPVDPHPQPPNQSSPPPKQ